MADETELIEKVAAYGSLVPYWAFSLATAGSFYAGTRWIGAHFKPEFKSKLTHWLNGTYEDTWTAQFGRLFDTVFGEKHFSWKRLYRSAVASVLSVIFLYVLFAHILGVMGERSFGAIPFWQVLLLGAAINIIPDYLSLIETRWLLRRFERVRSFPLQIVLLLVDLVFTAAIIFGAINLYALIFVDGRPPSWVELVALFSPLAILFYSTFLTSIWAWLYCLSTWFIRLFTKLGLRRVLDVKADPVKQIALVGSALVLVGGLALGPAVNPEKGGFVSSFDEWICEWDFGACVHAARISVKDPDTAKRAAHFMALACNSEADEDCYYQLNKYFDGHLRDINSIWENACQAGLARACASIGYAYLNGIGTNVDYELALSTSKFACRQSVAPGCNNLGAMYELGHGVPMDFEKAVDLYMRACAAGHVHGCFNLALMYSDGRGVAIDLKRAAQLYSRSCKAGVMRGCFRLGVAYEEGEGVAIDLPRASDLYSQACESGEMRGCILLGWMYQEGLGVAVDLERAVSLYQQACDGGNQDACDFAEGLRAELAK